MKYCFFLLFAIGCSAQQPSREYLKGFHDGVKEKVMAPMALECYYPPQNEYQQGYVEGLSEINNFYMNELLKYDYRSKNMNRISQVVLDKLLFNVDTSGNCTTN